MGRGPRRSGKNIEWAGLVRNMGEMIGVIVLVFSMRQFVTIPGPCLTLHVSTRGRTYLI